MHKIIRTFWSCYLVWYSIMIHEWINSGLKPYQIYLPFAQYAALFFRFLIYLNLFVDWCRHSKRCRTSNHQGEPAPKPDPSISQGDSIPKPDSTVSQEDSAPKPNPSVSQKSLAPKPDPYVSHEYSVPKQDPYVYGMNHETRGKFLIINNKNFCRKEHKLLQLLYFKTLLQ